MAIIRIARGNAGWDPRQWGGAGMTAYGLLDVVAHDGLVHRRWPFKVVPRRGYLKRLYMAHRLHHAVRGREGCVSFGFIYARKPADLQAILRERHGRPPKRDAAKDQPDAASPSSSSPE